MAVNFNYSSVHFGSHGVVSSFVSSSSAMRPPFKRPPFPSQFGMGGSPWLNKFMGHYQNLLNRPPFIPPFKPRPLPFPGHPHHPHPSPHPHPITPGPITPQPIEPPVYVARYGIGLGVSIA